MSFICKNIQLMKFLLIALGLFISAASHAQFGYYLQGGGNYSHIGINGEGKQTGKGGFGGQLGGGVEYYTHFNFFLYLGAHIAYENFQRDSTGASGSQESHYDYKPIFVSLPFGAAYQFDLSENLGLKLYGGMDVQFGIGGKVTQHSLLYDSTGDLIKNITISREIMYGRTSNKNAFFDLANANMGFVLGAGLNLGRAIEVNGTYRFGLKNIFPGGETTANTSWLSYAQINLKFYIPKHYYHTAKEKPYQN
jgi:hypothetical protein